MNTTPTGAQLIEAERARQLAKGFTVKSDAERPGALIVSAMARLERATPRDPEDRHLLIEAGALIAATLDALTYAPPVPPVRGHDLTDRTELVEGMAVADRQGEAWWVHGRTLLWAKTYGSAKDGYARDATAGVLSLSELLATGYAPFIITHVPEATS